MDKKWFMGLFIIFVMVFSVFGIVLSYTGSDSPQVSRYNGFKFSSVNNQFFAKVNGVEKGFLFFPGDLEYIVVPDEARTLLAKPALTISYDPKSPLVENFADAQYYLEVQLDDKAIVRALTDNEGTQLEKASCEDATEDQPVILFKDGSQGISVEGSCIVVSSTAVQEVYRQTERIVYQVLGVMK